jgi:hypothetical protein
LRESGGEGPRERTTSASGAQGTGRARGIHEEPGEGEGERASGE